MLGSVIVTHDGRVGARRYLAEAHRSLKPGGIFVCQFETFRPRRSGDLLSEYFGSLVKGYFSVVQLETIAAEYAPYLRLPLLEKAPGLGGIARKLVQKHDSALFIVAGRE